MGEHRCRIFRLDFAPTGFLTKDRANYTFDESVKKVHAQLFTMDLSVLSHEDSKKTRKKMRKKYKKIMVINKEDFTLDDREKEEEKGEAAMVFGDPNCLMSSQKNRSFKKGTNVPVNSRRKVQWNDENNKNLMHVREFVPSDSSDDDYNDDGFDSCVCVLM